MGLTPSQYKTYVRFNLKEGDYETVAKILSAADELFSQNGYQRASLRQLTGKAGVNLAAVNYHFGNKESLYRAVIKRRLQPINRSRLEKLAEAERAAGGGPVALPLLLEIFAGPLFALGRDTGQGGHHIIRLVGRSMAEPLPFIDELLAEEFHPVTARFAQAMRRHVPQLAPEDYLWRLSFVVGAMQHTLATMHRMKDLTRGICANNDHDGALRRFIQFAALALTAPTAS
jgi:AcrR family transcriptional regulator